MEVILERKDIKAWMKKNKYRSYLYVKELENSVKKK